MVADTVHFAEFAAARLLVQAALNAQHDIYVQAITEATTTPDGAQAASLKAWRVVIYSPAGAESGDGDTLLLATAQALKKCL